MKALLWIGGLVALILALAIAYIGSGAYDVAADTPHWTLTQSAMESARTRSIARHSAGIEVPAVDDPALVTSAAGNYDAMCAGCHLKPGIESTEMSLGLYPAPPNLVKRPLEDPAAAFWTIKHGIKMTGMPAWGKTIEDPYIWGLVAFLDELPDMSVDRYRELVEASGGHHHGGSETDLDTERPDHEQEAGGESHTHDHAQNQGAHNESNAQLDVPASASAAASVVDHFSKALSSGDLTQAGAQLDPKVIILESGGAEHSAAEYLGGHAKGDADFLKGAHQVLNCRTARAVGDIAWVASESELHVQKDGEPSTIASTETMVLRSGKDGWKIVHIHWSSRVKEPGDSH